MKRFDYMGDDESTSLSLLQEDKSLEFGPLSLCKLKRVLGDFFQVDVSYYGIQYTKLFMDFHEAFEKFLELRKALRNTGYKQRLQNG